MYSPISERAFLAVALAALLAGCHGASTQQQTGEADAGAPHVPCAVPASAPLRDVCTIERTGDQITLRNPDGGFHRLVVSNGGATVAAADGARKAVVTSIDPQTIEVRIGGDRYRLNAQPEAPRP